MKLSGPEFALLGTAIVGLGVMSTCNKMAYKAGTVWGVQFAWSVVGVVALVISVVVSLAVFSKWAVPQNSPAVWFWVSLTWIVGHSAGMVVLYLLSRDDVGVVVPLTAAAPLVAMVAAIIFLGERFSFLRALGCALIVLGALLVRKS